MSDEELILTPEERDDLAATIYENFESEFIIIDHDTDCSVCKEHIDSGEEVLKIHRKIGGSIRFHHIYCRQCSDKAMKRAYKKTIQKHIEKLKRLSGRR
jgi:hypothetical protein